jgi:Diguanylate cyclase, GGDEF domain
MSPSGATVAAEQAVMAPALFTSRRLTDPGKYTKQIEGPAVDAAGTLFVMNLKVDHHGTGGVIGKIGPGTAKVRAVRQASERRSSRKSAICFPRIRLFPRTRYISAPLRLAPCSKSTRPCCRMAVRRTITDITGRKHAEQEIVRLAHHDALTGLTNRNLLHTRIEQAIGREKRCGDGFAVLCIDLDRFKAVDDTLGHSVGDELLRQFAERLTNCARDPDTVARPRRFSGALSGPTTAGSCERDLAGSNRSPPKRNRSHGLPFLNFGY